MFPETKPLGALRALLTAMESDGVYDRRRPSHPHRFLMRALSIALKVWPNQPRESTVRCQRTMPREKRSAPGCKQKSTVQASQTAGGTPTATRPKHERRRITDGLIGMSSAAILTIYGLGYAHTQNAYGATGTIAAVVPSPTTAGSNVPLILAATPTLAPGTYCDGT